MVSRVATGRAVEPHLTRTIGGVLQPTAEPSYWPMMGLPERELHMVREGMFAVVNEPGGTAPLARLPMSGVQLAGKTGSSQVRRVSRELREHGNFNSKNLPWEFRPHALFVAFAPYDAPRYAVALVVEHGNAGADVAAPLARDIMVDTLTRDPAGRRDGPGQKLAELGPAE
jgi:penicillin-binding protein 2